MTRSHQARTGEPDYRPSRWQHYSVNYAILGKPDVLRGLFAEGRTRQEIAGMCNCSPETVTRWARLYGISLRDLRQKQQAPEPPKARARLTFADILEIGARVCRQRHGRCWEQCPHADDCDDTACRYDPKEDASYDPWWD